jgi:hypothetical protein
MADCLHQQWAMRFLLLIAILLVAAANACSTSPMAGSGASLPDALPDGGPSCGSGATPLPTCPAGSFCMEKALSGVWVCKQVPTACASDPTCACLVQQGAYDCPRGLWECQPNDAGAAIEIGCLAN